MMIRHMVLFSLRPDLEPADQEWLFNEMRSVSKLPTIRNFAVGRCLNPKEEWYKPRLSYEFDYAITMEFENEDALYTYQTHPQHVAFAQEIRKRTSAIKVLDFVTL